jgi:hypothetical protein
LRRGAHGYEPRVPDDARPDRDLIAQHVHAVGTRSDLEAHHLLFALTRRVWPAGPADRLERGAAEWVRRWSPRPHRHELPLCASPHGRCGWCN